MSSKICILLFVVFIGPLLVSQSQTTQTTQGCNQGQGPTAITITVSDSGGTPKVDKDTVEVCKSAGDYVVWEGSPKGLKFGIVFDTTDKPFDGAYFTESDNRSNQITGDANPSHKYKYRVYFPKSGHVLDPGIIIK